MISTQVAGLFGAWLGSLVLRRFFVERRPNALRAASALMLVALALTFSLKALGFSGAAALAAVWKSNFKRPTPPTHSSTH